MLTREPCAAGGCVAYADGADGVCAAHRVGRLVRRVCVGDKCTRCGHAIRVGEWVTLESTALELTHVSCALPPALPRRRGPRLTPLFDAGEAR